MRRTARRWRTPPAITQGSEAFEGLGVLDEIGGPPGLVLWQALRDVGLWAALEPEERGEVFVPGADAALAAMVRAAGVDVQLEPPLAAVVRLLADPGGTPGEAVEAACRGISGWADAHGHLATSIAFAQAAALAVPRNAGAACAVGRLARRRAEYARAETWFRRSIALARQSGDWAAYAQAFSGLGNLYLQRGNYPAARRFQVRSLRAARRHSLRPIQGAAMHDLFVIAAGSNQPGDAERYAREAFHLYGAGHERLAALAADIAYYWMERGYFAPAHAVFEALLPHLQRPDERLTGLANTARAAAGAGERRRFEESWDEAWGAVTRGEPGAGAAQVLLELARGAAQLGEGERAQRAAERAVGLAGARGESRTLLAAEAVLDAAWRGRAGLAAPAPPSPAAAAETDAFAADLVRTLHAALLAR